MNIVNIDADTFEKMLSKFEKFASRMEQLCHLHGEKDINEWLDNQDVCLLLKISPRTLQTLRDNGTLAYTKISHKLANAEENDINYHKGIVYAALGEKDKAISYFQKATTGLKDPQQAFFYNDQQPDNIFYQGLAWSKLGEQNKANERFSKLIEHGEKHMNDNCSIDYFAVSLPDLAVWEDNLNDRNKIHCNYVIGLGYLGLNDKRAIIYLKKVLKQDINHQGAQVHLAMLENKV